MTDFSRTRDDPHSSHLLECIRLRLIFRHYNSPLVMIDHIAINGNDGIEFVRYDLHLVFGNVHLHG